MGYHETANLKLKKPTPLTSETEWPDMMNGNFDTLDAEIAARHKPGDAFPENIVPDTDNTRSIGSAVKRFSSAFFNKASFSEITLGGAARTTWPSPGSGSQSMDDTYNNGSVVAVDTTDEVHRLATGKRFRLTNADGTVIYMEAEGGKGLRQPLFQNLLSNSQFSIWSNATLEDVGNTLVTNGADWAGASGTTPPAGWSAYGTVTSFTVLSGELKVTTGGSYAGLSQPMVVTAGKLYRLAFGYHHDSGQAASWRLQDATHSTWIKPTSDLPSNTGSSSTVSLVFKAPHGCASVGFHFYGKNSGSAVYLDNVTLYEVTPGCVAQDTKAPDGWVKWSNNVNRAPGLYREHIMSDGSLYALKVTGDDTYEQVSWGYHHVFQSAAPNPALLARFAGRTVTLGAKVKTSVAAKARLALYDGTTTTYSPYHSGSGSDEWLEVSATIGTGPGSFAAILLSGLSNTAYFRDVMLVFGPRIGEGNYIPMPNEVITFETPIASALEANGYSTTTAAFKDIEADTLGRIGKGARIVDYHARITDSVSLSNPAQIDFSNVQSGTDGNATSIVSACGNPNNVPAHGNGRIILVSDGYYLTIVASGSGTLSIDHLKYHAAQL